MLDFGDLTGTGMSPPLGRRLFFDWPVLHEILFHTNKTVQVFFFLLLFSFSVHFNYMYTLYLWLLFLIIF